MENNEEAADDQGSGWFQVKKKHRRFSIQSWVGGFTAKSSTNFLRNSHASNEKVRSSHGKYISHVHESGRNSAADDKGNTEKSTAFSNAEEKGVSNCGDCVVKQEGDPSKMPPLVASSCNGENVGDPGIQLKNKFNVVHKFKWGALEDDDLAPHHQSSLGVGIKFGNISDNNLLACRKHEYDSEAVSSSSSATFSPHHHSLCSSNLHQRQFVATKVDPCTDSKAPTHKGGIIEESREEVDVKMVNVVEPESSHKVLVPDVSNQMLAQIEDDSDFKKGNGQDNESPNNGPDQHPQNKHGPEIKFGEIKNDNLTGMRNHESNRNSSPMEINELVDINSYAVTYNNIVTVESCEEMIGTASGLMNRGSDSDSRVVLVNEKTNEMDDLNCSYQFSAEASTAMNIEEPVVVTNVKESSISEVSVRDVGASTVEAITQDTYTLQPEKNRLETSGSKTLASSLDRTTNQHDGKMHDGLSKTQIKNALGDSEKKAEKDGLKLSGNSTVKASASESGDSDARSMTASEEGETAESKERFRQRLWCFLFENLNRAIDELYLLCELECDKEQMKEAILVLEEAASDFNELTIRVEEFENVKKSSSQATDGVPMTLKSDHRRPHALSWEVRRMTTSPHRAEILASSLEAFRKIQQERASLLAQYQASGDFLKNSIVISDLTTSNKDLGTIPGKERSSLDFNPRSGTAEKMNVDSGKSSKGNFVDVHHAPEMSSSFDINLARVPCKNRSSPPGVGKKRESVVSENDKLILKKDKVPASNVDKNLKSMDQSKKQGLVPEKDKDKRNTSTWKTMDAWKEKRNWEDILSSRVSHSPGMSRKSAERARILHEKLMSPEKKKKTTLDLRKEAEEKHARAMRIKSELENERVQKLQRTSEKLNRVSEWQAVRSMKLREGMHARHQRGESRHEAYLAQVVKRAGDESSKVNEVRFITSLNEENKKLILRQKLQDSELRRAEKLQIMKIKQKEDMAREEAVLERKKLIEAEKLQRLAEIQRKKEDAQVRREEERKASSAAREARAIEQLRRKEERAKAQQEEAELLAQKLAEKLRESEQRRKFFLEQIRERASMDFRDQSSPFLRRSVNNKEGQGRSTPTNSSDDYQANNITGLSGTLQPSLKRRVKKIRQRLMAMKYEFSEPPAGFESAGIGFRTALGAARAKIGRWLQELKKLRQARKEGAASIGLIVAEMIKFSDGKEAELHASRQAGLLDFISSTLPASHTSKPEACQVTIYLLKLLRVVLSAPTNRSYFLAQNLLSPIIPMLSAALENYIKIAASLNISGTINSQSSKTSAENLESITEVLDGFLCIVGTVIGHRSSDDREIQMRDGLLELLIAYQVIHRLRDLFALYDRPQVEASPFPSTILLSTHLLVVSTSRLEASASIDWESLPMEAVTVECKGVTLGSIVVPFPGAPDDALRKMNKFDDVTCFNGYFERKMTDGSGELNAAVKDGVQAPDVPKRVLVHQKEGEDLVDVSGEQRDGNELSCKGPVSFLLSAISETGAVCLPSLLTSVLLQANNRLSSEQSSNVLPSNFEEVATGVLRVLNNLALLDIKFIQKMLARPDLKMEFFHIMSFLLSHCTSKWKTTTDQVGLLLVESLLLLGHFSLFHPGNQAVLRWGKSPTILHKVCDLPFVFFSDPELMPVLAATLVAACYGCEQNKAVVQQELSLDMLLSLLKSCRNALPVTRSNQNLEDPISESCSELNLETKKSQGDNVSTKSNRYNCRSTRISLGKGAASGNTVRVSKSRNQRDGKATKSFEETTFEHNFSVSEGSMMLHCRFPCSFIDRAELFLSRGVPEMDEAA